MTGRSRSQVIIGYHAITEYLRRGGNAVLYLVAKEHSPAQKFKDLSRLAEVNGIEVRELSSVDDLVAIGGVGKENARLSRGAALVLFDQKSDQPSSPTSLRDFLEGLGEGPRLVLLLDGVTDPQNLGAVVRSTDQFAVDLLILPSHRSAQETDTVARTSSGASAYVPTLQVSNLHSAIHLLKESGFWVYGADMSGIPASECDLNGRVALVMGSEGAGLSRLVRKSCDKMMSIPTRGHIDSLNIAVAAGILMYEIRRQQWRRIAD